MAYKPTQNMVARWENEVMQKPMTLTLPLPPSANVYWRMWRGHMVVSTEAKNYKVAAGWMAKAAGVEPLRGAVAVTMTVYRARKSGDLDNRIKVTMDAMNGIAWEDDSQVVELHAYLRDDKNAPRIELSIQEA